MRLNPITTACGTILDRDIPVGPLRRSENFVWSLIGIVEVSLSDRYHQFSPLLALSQQQGPNIWISSIFISSPEPWGSQVELIVYPYSGVRCRRWRHCRRQQCLNIFSSETAMPIKAKFYVESPWEGGTKVCINGPDHMTKMAAMPIYGKNL